MIAWTPLNLRGGRKRGEEIGASLPKAQQLQPTVLVRSRFLRPPSWPRLESLLSLIPVSRTRGQLLQLQGPCFPKQLQSSFIVNSTLSTVSRPGIPRHKTKVDTLTSQTPREQGIGCGVEADTRLDCRHAGCCPATGDSPCPRPWKGSEAKPPWSSKSVTRY